MPETPYLFLALTVLGMNVIPAFMPPTWTVLVFFYLTFHLAPVTVVLIGATCATTGRVLLYYLAQYRFRPFLGRKSQINLDHLSRFFNKKRKLTVAMLLLYAFSPIPSNQVYIMAGLAKIRVKVIATIFFFGRLLSYSLWIGSAHLAAKSIEQIFTHHYAQGTTFAIELIGLGAIYFMTKIDWKRYLKV